MDNPLISVLVPCYNTEKYIGKAIESVLAQTFTDFELILLSDGSTDRSVEIMNEYAQKDSRIRVIDRENRGVAISRNQLIKEARGKYLMYVDSDDTINKYMLEDMITVMNEENAELVICQAAIVHEDTDLDAIPLDRNSERIVQDRLQTLRSFMVTSSFYHYPVTKLFSREILEGVEFPPNRVYEDSSTMFKIYNNIKTKSVLINRPYYHYLVGREDSIMTKKYSAKHLNDQYLYINEKYDFIDKNVPELKNINKLSSVRNMFTLLIRVYGSKDEELINSAIVQDIKQRIPVLFDSIEDLSEMDAILERFHLILIYFVKNGKMKEFEEAMDFIDETKIRAKKV